MLNGASPRSPTMSWLPPAPDFRGDLRAALDHAKPADAWNAWRRWPAIGSGSWRPFSSIAPSRDWM